MSDIKAGHYYAIKYRGKGNGDLIVGRVKSFRANGDVVSTNLLNGRTSTKDAKQFIRRNKRVRKKDADSLLELWDSCKDKQVVREAAVLLSAFGTRKKQQDLPMEKKLVLMSNRDLLEEKIKQLTTKFVLDILSLVDNR